ncbi:hypothetical protein GJ496_004475 [Pomphorhynchus laevis]|nr:hypothetical protein GJ496_004475 [Pomphorhynchus laevis]
MESICNTFTDDRCLENEEALNAIFATVNRTNNSLLEFRIVMPKKFNEFMLQVVIPDGNRVGKFIDAERNFSNSCIEYADYKSDTPLTNETEIAFTTLYEMNSTINYTTTLVFGAPLARNGCFQWKELLNFTGANYSIGFVEILIQPPAISPNTTKSDNNTVTENIANYTSPITTPLAVASTDIVTAKPKNSGLGYLSDGTWVFFVKGHIITTTTEYNDEDNDLR